MKRRPKAKPRVTQLDRIELRLRKLHLSFDGVENYVKVREHCAVLASHNRRLLEENDTLRRWLKRLQARSTGTTPDAPVDSVAAGMHRILKEHQKE